ncbi:nesprin-1 [Caerostris extrusa]|uniref:Nesprin-1 n=1 Tax=Caerostris extrusa TaxID=172846 RepID=A0AAV4P9I9_CAEEX|nr:nesprin-1 [Caerostris extrusa]
MSLFLDAQASHECISVTGQIEIVPKICCHFKEWCSTPNFQDETLLVCLLCGCISISMFAASSYESFPILQTSEYWSELASRILRKLDKKLLVLFHSYQSINKNSSSKESNTAFEYKLKSISDSDPMMSNLFLPSNFSQRKAKLKLKFDVIDQDSVVITDLTNYVMIPFEIKEAECLVSKNYKTVGEEKEFGDGEESNMKQNFHDNVSKSKCEKVVEEEICHSGTITHQDGSLQLKMKPSEFDSNFSRNMDPASQEIIVTQNVAHQQFAIPESLTGVPSKPTVEESHEEGTIILADNSLQSYKKDIRKEMLQTDNVASSNISEKKELNKFTDSDSTQAFSKVISEHSSSRDFVQIPGESINSGMEKISSSTVSQHATHSASSFQIRNDTPSLISSSEAVLPSSGEDVLSQLMTQQGFATSSTSRKVMSSKVTEIGDSDSFFSKGQQDSTSTKITKSSRSEVKVSSRQIRSVVTKSFTSSTGEKIVHVSSENMDPNAMFSDFKEYQASSESKSNTMRSISTSSSQQKSVTSTSQQKQVSSTARSQFIKTQSEGTKENYSVSEFENQMFSPELIEKAESVETLPIVEEDPTCESADSKEQYAASYVEFDEKNSGLNFSSQDFEGKQIKREISTKSSQFAVAQSVVKQVKYSSTVLKDGSPQTLGEWETFPSPAFNSSNEAINVTSNIKGQQIDVSSTLFSGDSNEQLQNFYLSDFNQFSKNTPNSQMLECSIPEKEETNQNIEDLQTTSQTSVVTKRSIITQSKKSVVQRSTKIVHVHDEKDLPGPTDNVILGQSIESTSGITFKSITSSKDFDGDKKTDYFKSVPDSIDTEVVSKLIPDTKTNKKKKKKTKIIAGQDNKLSPQEVLEDSSKPCETVEFEEISSELPEKENVIEFSDNSTAKTAVKTLNDNDISGNIEEISRTTSDVTSISKDDISIRSSDSEINSEIYDNYKGSRSVTKTVKKMTLYETFSDSDGKQVFNNATEMKSSGQEADSAVIAQKTPETKQKKNKKKKKSPNDKESDEIENKNLSLTNVKSTEKTTKGDKKTIDLPFKSKKQVQKITERQLVIGINAVPIDDKSPLSFFKNEQVLAEVDSSVQITADSFGEQENDFSKLPVVTKSLSSNVTLSHRDDDQLGDADDTKKDTLSDKISTVETTEVEKICSSEKKENDKTQTTTYSRIQTVQSDVSENNKTSTEYNKEISTETLSLVISEGEIPNENEKKDLSISVDNFSETNILKKIVCPEGEEMVSKNKKAKKKPKTKVTSPVVLTEKISDENNDTCSSQGTTSNISEDASVIQYEKLVDDDSSQVIESVSKDEVVSPVSTVPCDSQSNNLTESKTSKKKRKKNKNKKRDYISENNSKSSEDKNISIEKNTQPTESHNKRKFQPDVYDHKELDKRKEIDSTLLEVTSKIISEDQIHTSPPIDEKIPITKDIPSTKSHESIRAVTDASKTVPGNISTDKNIPIERDSQLTEYPGVKESQSGINIRLEERNAPSKLLEDKSKIIPEYQSDISIKNDSQPIETSGVKVSQSDIVNEREDRTTPSKEKKKSKKKKETSKMIPEDQRDISTNEKIPIEKDSQPIKSGVKKSQSDTDNQLEERTIPTTLSEDTFRIIPEDQKDISDEKIPIEKDSQPNKSGVKGSQSDTDNQLEERTIPTTLSEDTSRIIPEDQKDTSDEKIPIEKDSQPNKSGVKESQSDTDNQLEERTIPTTLSEDTSRIISEDQKDTSDEKIPIEKDSQPIKSGVKESQSDTDNQFEERTIPSTLSEDRSRIIPEDQRDISDKKFPIEKDSQPIKSGVKESQSDTDNQLGERTTSSTLPEDTSKIISEDQKDTSDEKIPIEKDSQPIKSGVKESQSDTDNQFEERTIPSTLSEDRSRIIPEDQRDISDKKFPIEKDSQPIKSGVKESQSDTDNQLGERTTSLTLPEDTSKIISENGRDISDEKIEIEKDCQPIKSGVKKSQSDTDNQLEGRTIPSTLSEDTSRNIPEDQKDTSDEKIPIEKDSQPITSGVKESQSDTDNQLEERTIPTTLSEDTSRIIPEDQKDTSDEKIPIEKDSQPIKSSSIKESQSDIDNQLEERITVISALPEDIPKIIPANNSTDESIPIERDSQLTKSSDLITFQSDIDTQLEDRKATPSTLLEDTSRIIPEDQRNTSDEKIPIEKDSQPNESSGVKVSQSDIVNELEKRKATPSTLPKDISKMVPVHQRDISTDEKIPSEKHSQPIKSSDVKQSQFDVDNQLEKRKATPSTLVKDTSKIIPEDQRNISTEEKIEIERDLQLTKSSGVKESQLDIDYQLEERTTISTLPEDTFKIIPEGHRDTSTDKSIPIKKDSRLTESSGVKESQSDIDNQLEERNATPLTLPEHTSKIIQEDQKCIHLKSDGKTPTEKDTKLNKPISSVADASEQNQLNKRKTITPYDPKEITENILQRQENLSLTTEEKILIQTGMLLPETFDLREPQPEILTLGQLEERKTPPSVLPQITTSKRIFGEQKNICFIEDEVNKSAPFTEWHEPVDSVIGSYETNQLEERKTIPFSPTEITSKTIHCHQKEIPLSIQQNVISTEVLELPCVKTVAYETGENIVLTSGDKLTIQEKTTQEIVLGIEVKESEAQLKMHKVSKEKLTPGILTSHSKPLKGVADYSVEIDYSVNTDTDIKPDLSLEKGHVHLSDEVHLEDASKGEIEKISEKVTLEKSNNVETSSISEHANKNGELKPSLNTITDSDISEKPLDTIDNEGLGKDVASENSSKDDSVISKNLLKRKRNLVYLKFHMISLVTYTMITGKL